MERLTGADAAFLAIESPTMHMHITAALVFDPSGEAPGPVFARVREMVEDRLWKVPVFRRQVVEVPFGLQHPVWVEDPGFDIDHHVRRACVPSPGGDRELSELLADLSSRPLDRRRPLWEFHVVEGLENGCMALVAKIHHALFDGVAGAELLANFFDLEADPSPEDAPEVTWGPEVLPTRSELLRDAVASLRSQPESVARKLRHTVEAIRELTVRNSTLDCEPPPSPFRVPRVSFNGAISPARRVAFVEVPMADVRYVKEELGGTVNDVVLAMLSGATRALLAGRGEDPDAPLVAMVPVSKRSVRERHVIGNRISAMFVELGTDLDDPAERLDAIVRSARAAKEQEEEVGLEPFTGLAYAALPALTTRVSRLAANLRIFDHVPPVFNVMSSNVRGPDFPLYIAGSRLVAVYPFGPVADGAGLNVTVFSYQDTLFCGLQACRDLVPEVDALAGWMRDALAELVKAAHGTDFPGG